MAKVPDFQTAFSLVDRSSDLFFPKDAVGAKQSFKAECDVNNIIRQYSQTGQFTHLSLRSPVFGDVTGLDFRSMVEYVARAEEAFMQLPAEIRRRFDNDPHEFVDFCSDPANKPEMEKMGLIQSEKLVEAAKPPVEGPPSVGTVQAPAADPGAPVAPSKS